VQFGVVKSTVENIKKKREVILKVWEENYSNNRKRKP
jgi:hypothetical protein